MYVNTYVDVIVISIYHGIFHILIMICHFYILIYCHICSSSCSNLAYLIGIIMFKMLFLFLGRVILSVLSIR